MRVEERDELLARLDERTNNIWRTTKEQETHLKELNGSIQRQAVMIETNKGNIGSNRSNLFRIWWALGLIITLLGTCVVKLYVGT